MEIAKTNKQSQNPEFRKVELFDSVSGKSAWAEIHPTINPTEKDIYRDK